MSEVWPCILQVQSIYKKRDPMIFSVLVKEGTLYLNTPIKTIKDDLGTIVSIKNDNDEYVEKALEGEIITVKVEGENVMVGKHVFEESIVYSKISRESLDYMKVHCKDKIDIKCLKLFMKIKKVFDL